MAIVFLLLSLFLLYFSGRSLLFQLTHLVHRTGGSRRFLIVLWSLIFLPGTIIHELSHFFLAILVGARTGKIEIFPEFLDMDDEGGGVALGSVQTQKLNILQGVLVGLAPFFVGLGLMVWLGSLILLSFTSSDYVSLFLQSYLFFTISNSFFPSRSDLVHVVPAAITVVIIVAIAWLIGVQFSFSVSKTVADVVQTIFLTIVASTLLNLLIAFSLYLLRKLFR